MSSGDELSVEGVFLTSDHPVTLDFGVARRDLVHRRFLFAIGLCLLSSLMGILPATADASMAGLDCVLSQSSEILPSSAFEASTNTQLKKLMDTDTPALTRRAATRALAERYERGLGTDRDIIEAANLYQKAALVFPTAKGIYAPGFGNVLGSVTMVGGGGPVTVGDPIALARLAELYRDGVGVARDAAKADAFASCAASLQAKGRLLSSKQPSYFDQFTKPSGTPIPPADSTLFDRELSRFSVPADVTGLAWSPDGKYLAVQYDKGDRTTLMRVADGRRLWTVDRHYEFTVAAERILQFSADGQFLYLKGPLEKGRGQTQVMGAVSTTDGHIARIVTDTPPRSQALALTIAPDDHNRLFAVTGGAINQVVVYDTTTWNPSVFFELPNESPEWGYGFTSSRLAFDQDRGILWWAHGATLEILRASDSLHLKQAHAFNVQIQSMQINRRTGELVAGGSADSYSWRYPMNAPQAEIRNYRDDSVTLVRAFDPVSGQQTRTYPGPGGSVEGLSVSADGKFVAAVKSRMLGASPSFVLLWDAESGKLLSSKACGSENVGDVAFDPGGTRLAYAVGSVIHLVAVAR